MLESLYLIYAYTAIILYSYTYIIYQCSIGDIHYVSISFLCICNHFVTIKMLLQRDSHVHTIQMLLEIVEMIVNSHNTLALISSALIVLNISIFLAQFPSINCFLASFLGNPFSKLLRRTKLTMVPRLRAAFFFFFSLVNTQSTVGSNTLFLCTGTGVEVEEGNNFFSACAVTPVGFLPTRSQMVMAFDTAYDCVHQLIANI